MFVFFNRAGARAAITEEWPQRYLVFRHFSPGSLQKPATTILELIGKED